MFFGDQRTPEERRRDMEHNDKRRSENLMAVNFLKQIRKRLADEEGLEVGLVGQSTYSGAELLIESDGVTYSMSIKVNHDE